MTPSTADLKAFVTVSELQSFAAAARKLHLSQPALSRRISTLEKQLQVRLFDRTTRSVELTALGARFLSEVRNALESLDRSVESLHDVAHLEAGDVTIGCMFSAAHHFLPGVIRAFRQQHPRVLVRIVDETAAEVLASVKSGLADFAINYTGMQDPDVEFTPLMRECFVIACPAGHPLARRRSVSWSEFGEHPYALVSHESRIRVVIDHALAQVPRLPRPICEVRHVSTLIAMVESGLAITVVPELALPQRRDTVVAVRLGEPAIERTIGIVRRAGRSLSPAAESFAGMLTGAIDVAAKRRRSAA
jgi:DNA-binding transcriptional LysR family regulator